MPQTFQSMQLSWKTGKDVVAVGGKFEWQKEERVVSLISFSFISMCVSIVSSIRSGRKIKLTTKTKLSIILLLLYIKQ
jgi:hypothetical protein